MMNLMMCGGWNSCFERLDRVARHSAQREMIPVFNSAREEGVLSYLGSTWWNLERKCMHVAWESERGDESVCFWYGHFIINYFVEHW